MLYALGQFDLEIVKILPMIEKVIRLLSRREE